MSNSRNSRKKSFADVDNAFFSYLQRNIKSSTDELETNQDLLNAIEKDIHDDENKLSERDYPFLSRTLGKVNHIGECVNDLMGDFKRLKTPSARGSKLNPLKSVLSVTHINSCEQRLESMELICFDIQNTLLEAWDAKKEAGGVKGSG